MASFRRMPESRKRVGCTRSNSRRTNRPCSITPLAQAPFCPPRPPRGRLERRGGANPVVCNTVLVGLKCQSAPPGSTILHFLLSPRFVRGFFRLAQICSLVYPRGSSCEESV